MIGTGAISHKHAQAYKNIGFELTVCTDINEAGGRRFAEQWGAEFVPDYEAVCRHPKVDYVDVCTFPDFRLEPLEICAEMGKHIQVQKPIATNLETARAMIDTAARAGITLGVVSQHRFDDSVLFLKKAVAIAPVVDKRGLQARLDARNDPFVNVPLGDLACRAFNAEFFETAILNRGDANFLRVAGIDEKLGAHEPLFIALKRYRELFRSFSESANLVFI